MHVLGFAENHGELVRLLAQRRVDLRISQRALDDAAGLQEGYTGKIECGTRHLGPVSLETLLAALGLRLAVVEADQPLPARVEDLVGSRRALSPPPRILAAEALPKRREPS